MSSRVGYPGTRGQSGGVRSGSGNSSSSSSKMSREGSKEIPLDSMKASEPKPTKLDPTLLSSAISSGMPTFLLTKGVRALFGTRGGLVIKQRRTHGIVDRLSL